MKRIVFITLLMFCTLPLLAQRTYVLVTGVSDYRNGNSPLSQTTKDAKEFCEFMKTQTKNVTILTSKFATHDGVLEKLRAICNRAGKQDRVIFFFSGHGGKGCICTYDRNIQYSELFPILEQSAAKEKICFVDVCHAGSSAESLRNIKADILFFAACKDSEFSKENGFLGQGLFTNALLKALKERKADQNGDGKITIRELFKYVREDVKAKSKGQQTPQLIGKNPNAYLNVVIAQ